MIDSGEIRWAWDIARSGARRPEVRIWRDSLLAYLAREGGAAERADEAELGEVIAAILPKPWSRRLGGDGAGDGVAAAAVFVLPGRIPAGLIADGELSCVGPTGPDGIGGALSECVRVYEEEVDGTMMAEKPRWNVSQGDLGHLSAALRPMRTREEVAELMGVSVTLVCQLENSALRKIVRALRA